MVEVAERHDGVEEGASGGERPVGDAVVFGGGWVVAIGGEIVAYEFNTLFEEVALVEFERQAAFDANDEDAFEVGEQCGDAGGGEQDVINYDSADGLTGGGMTLTEKGVPLRVEDLHHAGVGGGCVAGSKR